MKIVSNVSMKPKLIVFFLIVGLLPLSIIGFIASNNASDALIKQAYSQLETVRALKKEAALELQHEWKGQLNGLVSTVGYLEDGAYERMSLSAVQKKKEIESFFSNLESNVALLGRDTELNRIAYEFSNVFKTSGTYSSEWKKLDSRYKWRMSNLRIKNRWKDILLINPEGAIVYSASKGGDLGESLRTGKLKNSKLGKAFYALSTGSLMSTIADFGAYDHAGGEQIAFMLTRLLDARSQVSGYIAVAIPKYEVNSIVHDRTGMGESGEGYYISLEEAVPTLRSDLVTMGNGKLVVGSPIKTEYLTMLKDQNKPVQGLFIDSSGTLCMIVGSPLAIEGLNWAVVVKMDLEEVLVQEKDGKSLLRDFARQSGFEDLYLIQNDGQIFYSVAQHEDYHTNLISGPYSTSMLSDVFRKASESGKYTLSDFAPYAASGNEPFAFLAQPVVKNGIIEFVVAIKMPLAALNKVMQQRDGMGKSGESYLVGSDYKMRSDSFLDPTNRSVAASFAGSVAQNGVKTEAVELALQGNTGSKIVVDYNGNPVLSAYAPLEFGGAKWALLAEIDEEEVQQPVAALKTSVQIVAAIIALAVAIFAYLIAVSITKPLSQVVNFSKSIARGDFEAKLDLDQKDEIGQLGDAVRSIPETLIEVIDTFNGISAAVSEGKLRERGEVDKFSGGYEELLKNTNALCDVFVDFFDAMPIVLMSVDTDSNVLFMNKFGTTISHSMRPEEIAGTKCYDHFKSTDCRTEQCVCTRSIQSGVEEKSEADMKMQGEDAHAGFSAIPISVDSQVVGAFKIMVNQTDIVQAQRKMQDLASNAVDISSQLSSAAEQLSAQIEESSRGAEMQRDRASETATSMEQMSATVLEVAQNASMAAENSETTRATAQDGAEAVQQVLTTIDSVQEMSSKLTTSMGALSEQVESIGEVMSVINDIADQTNLLALNAAIEAARAGEAGRGFAVVADEVRKLAENTMAATQQVGTAITSIQDVTKVNMEDAQRTAEVVEASTRQASRSGELLSSILNLANDSADQVRVIATASEEQSAATEQVVRATEQINQISGETSEAMLQSAHAVTELASLAERLNGLISEMRSS